MVASLGQAVSFGGHVAIRDFFSYVTFALQQRACEAFGDLNIALFVAVKIFDEMIEHDYTHFRNFFATVSLAANTLSADRAAIPPA